MDIWSFLNDYKAVISGTVIGTATITGATLNILYSKNIEKRLKHEKTASTTSALAADLLCNSGHLKELYLELYNLKSSKGDVSAYKYIDTKVYEELLPNIGDLGSAITFMVVDSYSFLRKAQTKSEILEVEQAIYKHKAALMTDIQQLLAKTISASVALYLYSDYLTGREWMKRIADQRVIRTKRSLEDFCKFIEKIDEQMEFISSEEEEGLEFRKRFARKADRNSIKELLAAIREVIAKLPNQPNWRAQFMCRGIAYKTQNTLTSFLEIGSNEYDILSEREYTRFL